MEDRNGSDGETMNEQPELIESQEENGVAYQIHARTGGRGVASIRIYDLDAEEVVGGRTTFYPTMEMAKVAYAELVATAIK